MQTEKIFIDLINKHQNIIHKITNVYMDDALSREDLFQEIVLQSWKSYQHFKGNAQFSTWLYRVALNTAITFFKKEVRIKKVMQVRQQQPEAVHDDSESINAQIQAMYKAIGNLSKIDKAIVMLYLEDYSHADMAGILGISANNVAVKLNRIKQKLKNQSQLYYQQ